MSNKYEVGSFLIKSSDIDKIKSILDTAWKDMDINFSVEPKEFNFDEIIKCTKLMTFRLSKTFEGMTFNIQYKGDKKFDVFIEGPFVTGRYQYNAKPISTPKYYDMRVEV